MTPNENPLTTGAEPGESGDRRSDDRLSVILNAQCLMGYNSLSDVWLIDVSQTGCQLFAQAGLFRQQQAVVILEAGGQRYRGRVAWAEGMKAGVQFDLAISGEQLSSLIAVRADSAQPAGEQDRLTDQFGRELAPLPAFAKARTLRRR